MNTHPSNTTDETPIGKQSQFSKNLISFIDACKQLLPAERIVLQAQEIYSSCTTLTQRKIPLALKLISAMEIKEIVVLANKFDIPLYTVSTGNNWGYGTANPVQNNCVILDLSLMNQILEMDTELSWIRVQPGVTQEQLHNYFVENKLPFLVPLTGAGPQGSILGNLLERGYGITPHQDHFDALLSLKAILADGRTFQSAFLEKAGHRVGHSFKWGIGPHLQSLFGQSNFGIVTEVTIALARKPEHCEAVIFTLRSDIDLSKAVVAIREMRQTLGTMMGGINLLNARRMVAMHLPYPKESIAPGDIMSDELLRKLCSQHNIAAWTGCGGLYGTKKMVSAARSFIRLTLKPFAKEIIFVSPKKHKFIKTVAQLVQHFSIGKKWKEMSLRVENLLDVVEGRPSRVALPLAYWKSGRKMPDPQQMNPAKDNCGLFWYSPVLSKNVDEVLAHVEFVENICRRFGMEPFITLTSINERCFDNPMPILYRTDDPDETLRAKSCYQALITEGSLRGYLPYRVGVEQMNLLTSDENSVYWDVVSTIKKALDPKSILSPGRYCKIGEETKR